MDIVNLYVNQNKQVSEIAKILKISKETVYNTLHENGYLATPGRRKEVVLKLKDAIEYYKENLKISVAKTAEKFIISEDCLSRALKSVGIDPSSRKFNIYSFDETIFDSIDTEEKAYWLGFIFADGCILSSPLNSTTPKYVFTMCLALIDTGHLFKLENFMQVDKSKVKVYDYTDYNGNKKQQAKFDLCNQHLWETLNSHGCTPNKSLTLKYPNCIKQDLKRHFLRGYFDGDGSFGIYGTRSLFGELNLSCVGTKDILDNLFSDFSVNMYHHNNHSEETLTITANSEKAKQILDYMYQDSTVYLDRKFNKYLEVCRLWEKSHRLSQTNIGENPEKENTEINTEIKKSVSS